jgi:hypothetical protein
MAMNENGKESNGGIKIKWPIMWMLVYLVGQAGAIIWWASAISERVTRIDSMGSVGTHERIAAVETRQEAIQSDLNIILYDLKEHRKSERQ